MLSFTPWEVNEFSIGKAVAAKGMMGHQNVTSDLERKFKEGKKKSIDQLHKLTDKSALQWHHGLWDICLTEIKQEKVQFALGAR